MSLIPYPKGDVIKTVFRGGTLQKYDPPEFTFEDVLTKVK